MTAVDDACLAAQKAAEARLEIAATVLEYEDCGELLGLSHAEYERAAAQLAGPYCGCNTCVVREVLDAAMPHVERVVALIQSEDN